MKKVLSFILISLTIFVNLFAPVSVGIGDKNLEVNKQVAEASDDCQVVGASWSITGGTTVERPELISLNIKTKNCKDDLFHHGYIREGSTVVFQAPDTFIQNDDFSISFNPGEEDCSKGLCNINFDFMINDGANTKRLVEYKSKKEDTLVYKCTVTDKKKDCDDSIEWRVPTAGVQGAQDTSSFTINFSATNKTITVSGVGPAMGVLPIMDTDSIEIGIYNADGTLVSSTILGENNPTVLNVKNDLLQNDKVSYSKTFKGLSSKTNYSLNIKSTFANYSFLSGENIITDVWTLDDNNQTVVPLPQGVVKNTQGIQQQGKSPDMPECSLNPLKPKVGGCIAQALYYVLFMPTSYVFALTGVFFDYTFSYSVQDTSYKSAFVVQGWGLVRDFCNVFFIFILLYIAIATILDLHGFKTKETIVNVVIIGLLINFSLFATQVIIDASNVMARVFYNSDAITITQGGANGITNATPTLKIGDGGVIPMSAALVNKINPQNIIFNSGKINDISDNTNTNPMNGNKDSLSAGSFIIIVLLTAAVNIVGIIVFFSVGFIFVARVVGLWIAMILAPLAFFTYIIPKFKGMKMIGWENWWPDTIKLAFLAPVFIFFMYIILKFLELNLIADPINKDGLTFFIATLIPFVFIMILMLKAKSIASDMSGEMGKQITNAVAAGGGMLLGGAALGTAFLGRRVVGAGLANMSRTKDAVDRGKQKIAFNKKLDDWKHHGGHGPKPKWEQHLADARARGENVGNKWNPITRIGAALNASQKKIGDIDHARHEIDETKKSAGMVDAKGNILDDSQLSGQDFEKLKTTFVKNKQSEVEASVRKGNDNVKDIELIDPTTNSKIIHTYTDANGQQQQRTLKGEEDFKKAKRSEVEADYLNENPQIGGAANLTDKDKKNIENELNKRFNLALKATVKVEAESKFEHERELSKTKVSMKERGLARSNKASWDVRNISEVKSDKRDGFFANINTKMIAGIALGVRTGLKSSGVNHGQGQADIFKDLGNTITEALKGVKIEVPKGGGGGHGGGHDNHGGGHDAHGGGHGGGHH